MPTATTNLDLPYRPCVGIMLINGDGLVWVGRRLPKWQGDRSAYIWQMPQGGITAGEAAEAAALRELEEETAVHSVEVLAEAPGWLSYDLPDELLGIALKGDIAARGRSGSRCASPARTARSIYPPALGHKAEFDDWRWAPAAEIPQLAVPFKRQIYADVVRTFAKFVR